MIKCYGYRFKNRDGSRMAWGWTDEDFKVLYVRCCVSTLSLLCLLSLLWSRGLTSTGHRSLWILCFRFLSLSSAISASLPDSLERALEGPRWQPDSRRRQPQIGTSESHNWFVLSLHLPCLRFSRYPSSHSIAVICILFSFIAHHFRALP